MSTTSPGSASVYTGFMSSLMAEHELGRLEDMPLYDPNDSGPVHPFICDLVDTFFTRLGSNYPFLHRDKFPKMVQEKRVEPVLVEAVCALAARFSDMPLFKKWNDGKLAKSEYGMFYAQRAKYAIVDTFPCPSVSAVQACLLMAYDGFGADQDSALWMYLGLAIRMAVDLGLTKEDGVRYQGEKDPWYTRSFARKAGDEDEEHETTSDHPDDEEERRLNPEEQKQVEQERIDTLWAVFFLDRVISSGTGRPVTLKDDDFELELPRTTVDIKSGWPDPMPTLLRIIHLYGRVSDVLNKIRHATELTEEKFLKLVQLENELTKLHQKTDPRLRFDANNFQAYVKNGQGTIFILLHFWFHALIIVLHQPTLLTRHGTVNRMHQLKAHSRELSMSSAKTIADILAFAELLDPKCFIGNPFTSQPIYIAANAFLMESMSNPSQSDSRDATPLDTKPEPPQVQQSKADSTTTDQKASSRHLLLASAANQNYQACYKALKQMHAYWGGVRYILNALDQKSEGIWDCETYTVEEYESTKRPRLTNTVRQLTNKPEYPASPAPESGPPLAWSLTGTTNSPNSKLTLLFQNPAVNGSTDLQNQTAAPVPTSAPTPPGNMIYDPIRPETGSMYPPPSPYPQPNTSAVRHSVSRSHTRRVSNSSNSGRAVPRFGNVASEDPVKSPSSDSRIAMGITPMGSLHQPFAAASQQSAGIPYQSTTSPGGRTQTNGASSTTTTSVGGVYPADGGPSNFAQGGTGLASSGYTSYMGPPGSNLQLLTIDNETDIGQHLTSFEQNEMMSWFGDYFPNDVLGFYPDHSMG
jgi:hypothetical protein